MNSDKTAVYKALYKPFLILGVPPKFIALESAIGGIILFVIRNYLLCILIALLHIIIAIVIHKEKEVKTILHFWLTISVEEAEKL